MIRRISAHALLGTAAAALIVGAGSAVPALIVGAGSAVPMTPTAMSTPFAAHPQAPPPPPAPKKCTAGYVNGLIGGQPKCLQNGQLCQSAHGGDYTHYGFRCTKVGPAFRLQGGKPAPAPPRPAPKPAPAPPHPPAPPHH